MGSALVQITACRLYGAKPLSKSIMGYGQLHRRKKRQFNCNQNKEKKSFTTMHLKISNNIPALVQIMAWQRPGDKPLYELLMVTLLTPICVTQPQSVNTFRPRQNGRHLADDIFKCIFLNENVWIPEKNSLRFVPKGRINNIPALVQIMPWQRPSDKQLYELMMVSLLTLICVTQPQWVNANHPKEYQLDLVFNIWLWSRKMIFNQAKENNLHYMRLKRVSCNLIWLTVHDKSPRNK